MFSSPKEFKCMFGATLLRPRAIRARPS
jgi:hypothetical protein